MLRLVIWLRRSGFGIGMGAQYSSHEPLTTYIIDPSCVGTPVHRCIQRQIEELRAGGYRARLVVAPNRVNDRDSCLVTIRYRGFGRIVRTLRIEPRAVPSGTAGTDYWLRVMHYTLDESTPPRKDLGQDAT